MESIKPKVLTKYFPTTLDSTKATEIYNYLRDNIQWEEGVRSKSGSTRLAKPLDVGDDKTVDDILIYVMQKLNIETKYLINGIYLNYYKDGTHYTPSHSHKGMIQLIISLGATRTLKVGTKNYSLNNGDAIMFGSSAHSVPRETQPKGRISIATFMQPFSAPMYISLEQLGDQEWYNIVGR